MANVPSAKKRNRQRVTRRVRTQAIATRVRTGIKAVRKAIADKTKPQEALAAAIKLLDRAAQKGTMRRTTASRQISRLTRAANKA